VSSDDKLLAFCGRPIGFVTDSAGCTDISCSELLWKKENNSVALSCILCTMKHVESDCLLLCKVVPMGG